MIIYDLEIIRAIPPKDDKDRIPGIDYCAGWHDLAGMGIACAVTYSYEGDAYNHFILDLSLPDENHYQFIHHMGWNDAKSIIAGFNSRGFDDLLLTMTRHAPLLYNPTWDLLQHLWAAAGLDPEYNKETHTGFSLDAVARANGLPGKTGTGDQAPVLWQQRKHEMVLAYCENDVRLLRGLIDLVLDQGWLYDPRPCNPKLHIPAEPLAQLRAAHKTAMGRRK